jgi:hypothetical protein
VREKKARKIRKGFIKEINGENPSKNVVNYDTFPAKNERQNRYRKLKKLLKTGIPV